jgi:hypothetical protein
MPQENGKTHRRRAGVLGDQEHRACTERRWMLVRHAAEAVGGRPIGEVDDACWDALRARLLTAGATEREIDRLAVYFVTWIVNNTEPESEERQEQFEWLAGHLACTEMDIAVGIDDAFVAVKFPSRPRIH